MTENIEGIRNDTEELKKKLECALENTKKIELLESKVETLINYMKDKQEDDVIKNKVMNELNDFDIEHFMRKLLKMEKKISYFDKIKDSLSHMNQLEARLNDTAH